MRTTTLTAAGLLGLALLTPTSWAAPATAAAEACRDEAATVVGTGPTLTGTEGRDVIVTGTATVVDALAGDDLICVTDGGGAGAHLEIAAGYGADTVDTTALDGSYSLNVTLGEGADTFVGGAAAETVTTGFLQYGEGFDGDTDTVSTGAGVDRVYVGAHPSFGSTVRGFTDVVDLGPGDDSAMWGQGFEMQPGASLTGGPGDDRLFLGLNGQGATATIDMAAQTVEVARDSYTQLGGFSSFESADVAPDIFGVRSPIVDVIDFRGTSGDDELVVHLGRAGSTRMSIDTGAGDDRILFEGVRLRPGSRIDTGRGEDELVAAQAQGRLDLDLVRRVMRTRAVWLGSPVSATTRVAGVEHASLMAPELRLVGDGNDSELSVNGCDATVRGGAGDDRLTSFTGDPWWNTFSYDCSALAIRASATMSGGPGKDRLRGGAGNDRIRGEGGDDRLQGRGGNDVLLGGKGRDAADGGKGRDRCTAERERRCER